MSKRKIITIILAVLLLLSLSLLVWRLIYINHFSDKNSTVVVPDNIIGETSASDSSGSMTAATITLYKGNISDNKRFEVGNMLPGDREVKYFCLMIEHLDEVQVCFSSDIAEQTKNLGEVLNIKITHVGENKVLYNGKLSEMDEDGYTEILSKSLYDRTVIYYRIEISLPESVGNKYQGATLKADFNWAVENTDVLGEPDEIGGVGCAGCYSVYDWVWFYAAFEFLCLLALVISAHRK